MVGTPAVAHSVTVYYVLYKYGGMVGPTYVHIIFCFCFVSEPPCHREERSFLRVAFSPQNWPGLGQLGPRSFQGRQLCHVMPVANRHRHCAKYVACRGQFPVAFKFACSLQSARPGRNNFARSVEVGFLVWCRCDSPGS